MMIVKFTNRRLFVFLIALLSIWSSKLKAQFTITESFKGSAPQSAIVFGDAAFLTSSNGTDPVNQGWLRLTGSSGSSKGYAYVNKSFPSSLGTLIEFDYKSWRSTSDGLGGADGFTVFLFDANVSSFSLGAYGGSLGYASNTGTNGLSGGYLGIAIDEFGNFATAQEGRGTGINALDPSINQGPYPGSYPYIRPNSISVRGATKSDRAASNPYITGVTLAGNTVGNIMTTVGNLNENEVDYNTITSTRPTDATFYRRVQIDIKPTGTPNQYSVTVRWKKTPTGNFIDLMTFNTDPASPPPAQMKVGFAASTGNAWNNHEIRNVLVTTPGNIRISSRANVDVLRTVAGSNTISYTLDVVNDNPVPLTNVLFRDSLTDANGNMVPLSAFTITNVTTNGFNAGTTAGSSSTENKITGSLNIAANTTAKITITGTLNSVPDGNQLNNNASITPTDISDPDLDNNVTTASTPVLAEDIDVTLTKTVTDPCLNTSGNTFEIIVQNVGTLPTVTTNNNRILLRDTFPSTYNIAFAANAGWNSPNLTNLPNGTRAFAVTYTQPLNSSASTPPFRYTLTAPAGTPSYTDRAWVFYVNVSDQNIELTANRNNNSDADFIQVRSAAPTAVTSRAYCLGEAATALTATPSAGNTLLWYSTPTSVSSVNAPTPATSVAGTINYYVSQTNGSCESPLTTIAVTTQSAVSPGTIGTAQTICRAGTPAALTSITAGAGGSGTASYSWQSSTDGSNWTNISGATAVTYSPPALTQSTYFRRVYTSTLSGKACSANTPPILVTVQSDPTPGIIAGDQTICVGSSPVGFTSTTAGSGSGTITYRWESSTNGTTWTAISGQTGATYAPGGTPAVTTAYRRFAVSTSGTSVCTSTLADTVTVTVNQPPTASVAGSNITQYNSGTFTLAGNVPTAGTGTWSLVSGTGTIGAPNSPTSTVTIAANTSATLRWTISNAPCAASTSDVTVTYSRKSDVQITQTVSKTNPVVGENVTFTLSVKNNGPTDATGVSVTNALQAGYSFVSASSGSYNSSTNQWTVGNVANGATQTLTITARVLPNQSNYGNTATVTGAETDETPANNTSTLSSVTPVRSIDIQLAKAASPKPAVAGQALTYTLTLRNNGPSDLIATDTFDVTENLPNGFTASTYTPSAGVFSSATHRWTGLTLASGQSATLTIAGALAANATGSLSNTATVAVPATVNDPDLTNNSATDNTTISRVMNLGVTLTASPKPVIAGNTLTYTATLTNAGPGSLLAADVVNLVATLPSGFTATTYTPSAGTYTAGTGNWTGLTLATGQSATLTITGTVAATASGSLTNSVTVTAPAGTTDNVTTNNTASDNTTISRQADLGIVKSASLSNAVAGEPLTYTLTVSNSGPSAILPANAFTVTDVLPANFIPSTYTASSGTYNSTNGNLTGITLSPGQSMTIAIAGTVRASATGTLANTATISGASGFTDPVSTNNSNTITTPIIAKPALQITKTGASTLTAGSTVTYTLNIVNTGSSDAVNAAISDVVDAAITNVTWTATAAGTASVLTGASGSGNNVAVNGSIAAGAGNSITVTVTGTVNPGATGNISNTAAVAPAEPQGTGSNSSITSSVTSTSGVVIAKSAPSGASAGEQISYRVEVGNNGPSNATGVQIADVVAATLTNVTWTTQTQGAATITAGGTGSGNNVAVTANVPAGAAHKAIVNITGTVAPGFTGSLNNTATATPAETGSTPVSANAVTTISSRPVFTISKTAPATATAGNNINYVVTVRNTGPSNSTNSVITDVVPATLSNVTWTTQVTDGTATITAGATGSGNNVSVTGSFNANSTIQINITGSINPEVLGSISNVATVTPAEAGVTPVTSAAATTIVSAKSGLTIAKSGPATIVSGNNITYTITVGNDGPSNAVSAVIADVIPASIQNPSWTSTVQGSATILSGGSGSGSSVQTTANIPAGAGNKVILTITGKVNPALNGSITNTATATPTESNSPAPQSQVTTTANRTPALTITKNGPAALLAGANITYVVEITNGSLSDAVNAAISDAVPGQVSNVTWSAVATGTAVINSGASGSGSNVALNASIPAGSGNKVTVTISGKVSGAFNGTLTNQATVTPAESGTTATSSSVSTAISKIPVLAIQKTGPATISAGQVVTYTIRVNNTSTANANAAVITDTVAANIQNVTWTATASNGALISAGATGAGNNISVTADIPGAAMAEAVITVTGTLDASATGTVSNIATVTPAEAGAVVKRSGAVVTNISKTPNVSLIKTGPATINAGQTITYVIEAVNSGPSNADGIAISDVISPVLTNVSWTAVANGTSSVTTASGTGDVNVTGNLLAGIGNSIRITVTGTVPASQLNTTISNTATATPAETGVAVSSNMVETIISNRSGLVMSKSAPPTMNAGEIIHYTLTVTNNGPSNAVGALIQDNVAADIANVSWTAEASGDAAITTGTSGTGNQVSVTADIPAGNSSTVVVHITGTLIASYTNSSVLNTATVTPAETGNPVVNSNDAVTTVTRQSNLRISKTGPGSLSAGQVATYVLTVDNQGPSDVVDAVITDNLPAGISDATWTVVTAGGATASTTSGTGNVSLTTSMKAGGADKVIITLNAKVDPDLAAGTLVNTAQATPPVGVTDPSPASDTIRSAIGRTANVRVVKSGPADGRAGDQIVYVLRVTNDGPSSAPGTSITDNMPAGITAQSWTAVASGGATVSAPSGTGNVSLTADLPAQAGSVEITIVGEVDPALQTGNTVTNSASVAVASGITDPEAANNTSQITTRIDNSATFLVSKSGPANANVGDHVIYTILVKNTGLGNITDALIQDTVPPDVQVTSWQAVANGAAGILSSAPTSGSGNLIATNADIPAGTGNSILLTIQGVILPGAASNFTNRAVVTAGEVKQSSVTTSVNRSTDIAILKAGPQTLAAGEDITYTVNVFNNGNVDVQGLQILDNVYSFTSNVTWEATASGTAAVTGATSGTGNNINITGDIPAGQDNYITLTIRGTLPSSLPNTNILNSASVTLPSGITDYNPSNNVSEITTGVVLRPDIVITKTAPAVANAGEPISFTVNVTNNGPSDAYSVNITDAVNAAITNVNWTGTAANGATISSGGTGSVNNLAAVADIPAGANVTFVITGIINPDFAGNIDNQAGASVGAALPALSPLVTTVVTKRVSLEMTKSAIDTLSAGLPITYTLEVTNSGPSNTTGSVITDDIPGSIENVAWTTTEGNGAVVTAGGTGSGNNLSVTANIPNGGRVLITVTGIVASNTLDDLRNIAVVTPIEPGQEADSSAEVITVIKKTPQLRLLKSAPSTAASGEQITYTLQLSNVGPSDALNTQLSDVVPAEIRNVEWNATVAGGATIVTGQTGTGNNMQLTGNVPAGGAIDVTITGTIDPLFRGVISNTALATPSEDGIPEAQDTVSTLVSPSVNLVINKSGPARINAGDIINYQIMVSNQGPSTALDAVITDVIPAQVVNPQWTAVAQGNAVVGSGSSGSGSSVAVTANIPADDTSYILINISGVVSPAYEGTLSNMADVTAAEDNVVVPSAPVQTIVSRVPIVSISKSAPAMLRSGNAISYLITVGNTGTGDAQNMAISDVVPAVLTDVTWEAGSNGAATVSTPSGSGNINLTADIPAGDGNTVTIRVTGNVPETFSGDLVNTAVASPSESSAVADSSTATTAIYRSLITMVKTATNTVTKAGDVITYNLLLTNTGTAPLTDIVVADDGADAGSITPATISGIAPGASVTVTAAHTVTQADVDAGRVTNSANVDARAPDRSGVSDVSGNTADDDEPTVTLITPTPSVTLVKTVAPARAAVGEIVKYAFVVANTGNVTLNNVIVSDANAVITGSPVTTLAPGDSATLTGEHILTQADVDAGRVANSASVNASPAIGEATRDISGTTAGNNDSTILVLQSAGAITLTKAATNTGAKAGDVINYELVLKNVGNVTLSNFVVADAGADAGSITPAVIANLAPGASANITATHTLTQADVDRGIYRNQASVSAVDPQGNAVSLAGSDDPATPTPNDSTTSVITPTALINLVKTGTLSNGGNSITYTFVVTNSGNVTLSNVVLADPVIGLNKTLSGNIAPGASVTDTYDYTITQADRDKGMVTNSANVSATAPAGATVTDVSGTAADNDEPTVTVITSTAAVAMVKTGVFSGNTITYTFTITNTGNVTLSQLTYSDAKLGITDKALEVTGGLAPGATATATEIYTVTADDRTLGSVTNTATVNAQNPNGGGVSDVSGSSNDNDDATVTQVPNAPVAVNDAVTTNANNPVTINVLLNDDPISSTFDLQSVQVVTQPQHGTVILNQDGTITYTPAVGYVGADSLTYRVKDAFGFYTNEAKVNIAVTFTGIKAPTVFTPNGDGRNDRFVIAGLNQYVENELIIVNRWGNEVYRQRNYQQNWEALKLHEGTYYYLLRVKKSSNSQWEVIKGYVTVIRTLNQ